ncbi:pyroglutamyl-peptidase I [Rugosimonospora africana]|uniref:Pyroglutamyl-peptidase I n=1 Tax=Rugosimonospora africana TaxID=556532 RepID=A0A8J3QKW4_9ACTN|nr:pyroglutamyl-peptidase I [Rugosimonospora africana]GIH11972.1 pyrrolidone-carboxylate peptidase [Rugosimonospora africana]
MSPRVLLTGFEPFNGADLNPSWAAVRLAAASPLPGVDLHTQLLPCVFGAASEVLWDAVELLDPDAVIAVGQAGGNPGLAVERIAVNLDDATIPDNAGAQPVDQPIVPDGPVGYFATIPVKECVAAVRATGVPAAVSESAGRFVCNHVMYQLLHRAATRRPGRLIGGFVHVPFAPEQVLDTGRPCLPSSTVALGLRTVVTRVARVAG